MTESFGTEKAQQVLGLKNCSWDVLDGEDLAMIQSITDMLSAVAEF